MGRYSHSKIESFKKCPKAYDYQYNQDLNPIEDSIHQTVGKLFHSSLEAVTNFEPYKEYVDEFASIVRRGFLPNCDENTLEVIVNEYLHLYSDRDAHDEVLFVEEKFEHLTANDDVISGMFDKVYRRHEHVYVRDYKTTINKLKYTLPGVVQNRQLNLYSYILENDYLIENHFTEIDEVLIHRLDPVPYLNNGKPSKDTRKLAFVKYEDYKDALDMLGLDLDEEYQIILKQLKERGHPLFNRITVPVNKQLRSNIYEENLSVIRAIENKIPYRVLGPLCDYCAFQNLCTMEMTGGQDHLVKEIKKTHFKPSE